MVSGDFNLNLDGTPFLVRSDGNTSLYAFSNHGLSWTNGQKVAVRLAVNRPATGAPVIGGTAQVGEALTVATSGIDDPDGLGNATFSYQWIANGVTALVVRRIMRARDRPRTRRQPHGFNSTTGRRSVTAINLESPSTTGRLEELME